MATQTDSWILSTVSNGESKPRVPRSWSYSATLTGTGAVTATITIQVRAGSGGHWIDYGTMSLSGTTSVSDYLPPGDAPYVDHRAICSAISDTGASVVVSAAGGV